MLIRPSTYPILIDIESYSLYPSRCKTKASLCSFQLLQLFESIIFHNSFAYLPLSRLNTWKTKPILHSFQAVDWWSVGVLTYELLTGASPFTVEGEKNTQQEITKRIVRCSYPVPPDVSPEVQDFIRKWV